MTSVTHPLEISELICQAGLIGISMCPGKSGPSTWNGVWWRDLHTDLNVVEAWQADAMVTLMPTWELERYRVAALGSSIQARGMKWFHLPIKDRHAPDAAFEGLWRVAGEELAIILRNGGRVLTHCRGGIGRAGLVAARLLIEFGDQPGVAISKV